VAYGGKNRKKGGLPQPPPKEGAFLVICFQSAFKANFAQNAFSAILPPPPWGRPKREFWVKPVRLGGLLNKKPRSTSGAFAWLLGHSHKQKIFKYSCIGFLPKTQDQRLNT
jgi:hypothetical protein